MSSKTPPILIIEVVATFFSSPWRILNCRWFTLERARILSDHARVPGTTRTATCDRAFLDRTRKIWCRRLSRRRSDTT
jgi:hypothetical protein